MSSVADDASSAGSGGGGEGEENGSRWFQDDGSDDGDDVFEECFLVNDQAAAGCFDHLLCTNKDPYACGLCSDASVRTGQQLTACCGLRMCESCSKARLHQGKKKVLNCTACRRKVPRNADESSLLLLTAARRGEAWAQHNVARWYAKGRGVNQSHSEALYWYRKAAEQGHPKAYIDLGIKHAEGEGCVANPSEAERYFRMAANLNPAFHRDQRDWGICNLGNLFKEIGRYEEARDLFLPLAEEGNAEAQYRLGLLYSTHLRQDEKAVMWYKAAADQGNSLASSNLVCCYMRLGKHSLAKFWLDINFKAGLGLELRGQTLQNIMKSLKEDTEHCGSCSRPLSTPKQNMCKQCVTYCYCSRKCQIRHWNGGHRIDCKEVGRLKVRKEELAAMLEKDAN